MTIDKSTTIINLIDYFLLNEHDNNYKILDLYNIDLELNNRKDYNSFIKNCILCDLFDEFKNCIFEDSHDVKKLITYIDDNPININDLNLVSVYSDDLINTMFNVLIKCEYDDILQEHRHNTIDELLMECNAKVYDEFINMFINEFMSFLKNVDFEN
jgi:hypothetical protein